MDILLKKKDDSLSLGKILREIISLGGGKPIKYNRITSKVNSDRQIRRSELDPDLQFQREDVYNIYRRHNQICSLLNTHNQIGKTSLNSLVEEICRS